MKESTFITKQITRYETRELWKTDLGYELRTKLRDAESYETINGISDEEVSKFQKEAERQQAIWEEVDEQHETIADYSNKYGNFELQKMLNGSHRVVSFQSPLEEADDYKIFPAEAEDVEHFMKEADRWNELLGLSKHGDCR